MSRRSSASTLNKPAGTIGQVAGNRPKAVVLAVAIALTSVTGLVAAHAVPQTQSSSAAATMQVPGSFAGLVEDIQPAVVNVKVKGGTSGREEHSFQGFDIPEGIMPGDFIERFFGKDSRSPGSGGRMPKTQGLGSGFIVSPEGYIVTSHHVVEHAEEISVVLNDGRKLTATLKGTDPKTDLAVLKVTVDEPLPVVDFGDSDAARPGDWVLAIGNPFGLGGTVTTGIVSARGRDIQSGPYDDYLQIDAPINRGNSGGPLFDLNGKVIGVNTAIFSPTGGNVGIGFAVPAAQAGAVVQQLMRNGQVERGWLGVQIQGVTRELADSLDLPKAKGALVARVVDGSPASVAGIKTGDVIVNFDNRDIGEAKDLSRMVAGISAGEKVDVMVWRDGKQKRLAVSIGHAETATAAAGNPVEKSSDGRLGLSLAPMTPEIRTRYQVGEEVSGSVVVGVEDDGPADSVGVRLGDVIVRVANRPVNGPDEVAKALAGVSKDTKKVVFLINRRGNQWFVPVEPG